MSFSIKEAAKKVKKASNEIANLSTTQKNELLKSFADQLRNNSPMILAENKKDIDAAKENNLSDAMVDRLILNEERIEGIALALEELILLEDPVGRISNITTRPNGIQVGKMKIPLGVIAMIYESRPNVTADAAGLCLKAGNAVILRGGKEAFHSNMAIGACLKKAFEDTGVNSDGALIIPDTDRAVMNDLMKLHEDVDLIIPRGGEGLIRFVSENSTIPVIQHYKGVCHLYVDKDADLKIALDLLMNGKTQRTGVCNALETLVVHEDVADEFLTTVATEFTKKGVVIHADEKSMKFFEGATLATEEDYHAEYLALEIAIRQVPTYEAAVKHIQEYGSGHTEVICTNNYMTSQKFLKQINSAVVMVNASSRFSDGGQLGLGAEIGISTSKLHAYGPMGLEALTTEKFIVMGEGQIRS